MEGETNLTPAGLPFSVETMAVFFPAAVVAVSKTIPAMGVRFGVRVRFAAFGKLFFNGGYQAAQIIRQILFFAVGKTGKKPIKTVFGLGLFFRVRFIFA